MSKMLGKITFFGSFRILRILGFQQESKKKTSLTDKKSIFSNFLYMVGSKVIQNSVQLNIKMSYIYLAFATNFRSQGASLISLERV